MSCVATENKQAGGPLCLFRISESLCDGFEKLAFDIIFEELKARIIAVYRAPSRPLTTNEVLFKTEY